MYPSTVLNTASKHLILTEVRSTRWLSWLRYCAINHKVANSIPVDVTWGSTMALGLTQPLTEMSTRNIYLGVKAAGA